MRGLLCVLLCAGGPTVLGAQEEDSAQIERLVREGKVESLLSRFRGGRNPEELRLLALAQTNKAKRVVEDQARQRAFKAAEARYLTWISAVERARDVEHVRRIVDAAAARVECGRMILWTWAATDLDDFEITAGRRCQSKRLLELLVKARTLYEEAADALQPLADELLAGDAETEDRYLALGVYDAIPRLQLDARFSLGWANLYIGIVDSENSTRRTDRLRAAERGFQQVIDSGRSAETAAQCLLGLAMTLREQGRFDEARRYFAGALETVGDGPLAAQVRYEWARSDIRHGGFDEARVTLRPLVEKDPDALTAADQPARFYINLAHLWDANSYLEEAQQLLQMADKSTARKAIILQAQRAREIGLRKMNRLTARGGGWPELVQLFVADTIDDDADAKALSAAELLFSARQFMGMKKYHRALAQLQEAAGREEVAPDVAAEILFELGVCHYRSHETREAAEAFERLAREHKTHEKAAAAVTYAYQLWATIAEASDRREDYARLANVLQALVRDFPAHEQRAEALWWLPVALQAAGRYAEASEWFGKVSEDSPRWEEARYRRVLCRRLQFDEARASLSALQVRAQAAEVTAVLRSYAWEAHQRSGKAREWSAAALVSAAEVQASDGVEQYQAALDLLADFEQRYEERGQIGRVLAVRINAYRSLHRYDKAAQVVQQFLQAVSPDQAGGTLAAVARGMQEEVERLERDGDAAAARELAVRALPTFEELEKWAQADASRTKYRDAVWYGLAQMRYFAGQHDKARELVVELLARDARNGNYQRLNALVLTAALGEDASPERLAQARDAWGTMLRDPGLRSAAPERYWEARYRHLELLLRAGQATEVENAIRQERVWYPDFGGGRWKSKLNALYERAAAQMKQAADTARRAASQPSGTQPAGP